MRIIDVPIEPLEQRYSRDWIGWFIDEYNRQGVPWHRILPKPLKDNIETGAFLDVCGTNFFKSKQMMEISVLMDCGFFKDDDVFFFHDAWFPGLENLAYMRDALGLKFKITGALHAGCWDNEDYIYRKGMHKWGRWAEKAWLSILDAVFVATNFHKKLILKSHPEACDIVHVTGFPIFPKEEPNLWSLKKDIVVFPHRLDPEKQPEFFSRMADHITKYHKNLNAAFYLTMADCKSKAEYYKMLQKAKISVSYALQETWGIAMIESVFAGCIPLVPDRLSYQELYPSCFKYSPANEGYVTIAARIQQILEKNEPPKELHLLQKKFKIMGETAIPNILKILLSL